MKNWLWRDLFFPKESQKFCDMKLNDGIKGRDFRLLSQNLDFGFSRFCIVVVITLNLSQIFYFFFSTF